MLKFYLFRNNNVEYVLLLLNILCAIISFHFYDDVLFIEYLDFYRF